MKKILLPIIMFGVFSFFPIKPMAMIELDENGNAIEKEVKEGEVSILMAPDEGVASDETVSSDDENRILSTEEDGNYQVTAAGDDVIYQTTGVEEDTIKTTAEGDLAANNNEEKDSTTLPIIISGVLGMALGYGTTFLIRKRKQ